MKRRLFIGASATALLAALGLRYAPPLAGAVAAHPGKLLDLIEREFGAAIASSSGAQTFAQDYSTDMTWLPVSEEKAVFAFIRATNVIRALETGQELVYVGLEDLKDLPCRNTLSVGWL